MITKHFESNVKVLFIISFNQSLATYFVSLFFHSKLKLVATQVLHLQTPNATNINVREGKRDFVFDAQVLQNKLDIPSKFILPDHEKSNLKASMLKIPPIEMKGFLFNNPNTITGACLQLDEACKKYGFFLVMNHGVDSELIVEANKVREEFFTMKLFQKQSAKRQLGDYCGYASGFTSKFDSKLRQKRGTYLHVLC